jgi:hypothetical protein
MRHRSLALLASFGVVSVVVLLTWAQAAGQTSGAAPAKPPATAKPYAPPRTSSGQPDFHGVWANNTATPLERLKEFGDRALLTDEEVARLQKRANEIFGSGADAAFGDDFFKAALADDPKAADRSSRSFDKVTGNYSAVWLVEREFDRRTALITDPQNGRMPPLTADAEQRQNAFIAAARSAPATGRADGPEDRPLSERCITFGVPDTLAGYNSYYQFVQTPTYIAILTERIHDVRIIPLDGSPHLPSNVRLWLGDSRGHWEGDTLVVDTTNFSKESGFRQSNEHLHLVERFTRVSPTTLRYEFTIEDPTVWTRPWTAMIPLKISNDQIYEYACHEGNYALPGVLAGARAQEKTGREAVKTGSR